MSCIAVQQIKRAVCPVSAECRPAMPRSDGRDLCAGLVFYLFIISCTQPHRTQRSSGKADYINTIQSCIYYQYVHTPDTIFKRFTFQSSWVLLACFLLSLQLLCVCLTWHWTCWCWGWAGVGLMMSVLVYSSCIAAVNNQSRKFIKSSRTYST